MILTEVEITEKLSGLAGWEYSNGQIQKTFRLPDSEKSEKLMGQVMSIAENLNHHPVIESSGTNITFKLSTHSENGITEKDFALASEIDRAEDILMEG